MILIPNKSNFAKSKSKCTGILPPRLAEQIGVVRDCLAASRAATAKLAQALAVIHDEELYRLKRKSFEDFCAQEFDITRSRGYQLLDFARVVEHLRANNCGHLTIPERESHARLLAPLPPGQQIAWRRICHLQRPVLSRSSDGRFRETLDLPLGHCIRLGWGWKRGAAGGFRIG